MTHARFKPSSSRASQGGVLLVTVVICGAVGLALMAYLSMVTAQERFVHRSGVWNNCIAMCEAGIEEALAHINHSQTTSNFAVNGWTLTGSTFRKERQLNGGRFRMFIDTNYPPTITVRGTLPAPLHAAPITRHVRVRTQVSRRYPQAILAKSKITLGGSGRVDSFNSTNLLESLNGQYSEPLATDRATIATTSRTAGDFFVGNVSIYGSVGTGPGGTVTLGPNGNVGSKLFNDNPIFNGLIEAGHRTDDVNVYIPDAALPSGFGPATLLGPGTFGGTNYTYYAGNGDYQIATINMSSGHKMLVTGKARIFVSGSTSLTSDACIILGTNATVEWYAAGDVSFGGQGVVNGRGLAKNFSLVGLRTCSAVTYSGSAQFIGTVYAPSAVVKLTGTADAYGALVGNSIELSGGMGLHFDEALKADPGKARFLASSWQEIKL